MVSAIQQIRNATKMEEIDYNLVIGCLQEYASPRDVITRMLQAGELIRVKKGIYVFGKMYANRPYSLEVLANMIYGPSYVSCEYALSFYGLIPEAVHEVTSISLGRNKFFDTPVGRFSYRYLRPSKYTVGITRIEISGGVSALVASPEKALADTLYKRKEQDRNVETLCRILYDDYRIDPQELSQLRIGKMSEIANAHQDPTIQLLPEIIRGAKKNG